MQLALNFSRFSSLPVLPSPVYTFICQPFLPLFIAPVHVLFPWLSWIEHSVCFGMYTYTWQAQRPIIVPIARAVLQLQWPASECIGLFLPIPVFPFHSVMLPGNQNSSRWCGQCKIVVYNGCRKLNKLYLSSLCVLATSEGWLLLTASFLHRKYW